MCKFLAGMGENEAAVRAAAHNHTSWMTAQAESGGGGAREHGTLRWIVEQGFEMGRPSILEVEVDKKNGKTIAARVGGKTVVVCEGDMEL